MAAPEDLEDSIDRFFTYFSAQIEEIETLESEHAELYRKLLYVGVIDTLAGTMMPKRKNKDRFIAFVRRFCKWSDGERISLPHLVQLLRKNPDPTFERLRTWALAKYNKLPVHSGLPMPISEDPVFDEVRREWPTSPDHREPIEGVDLPSLRHFNLLYTYRNALVHELRMLGYGTEFGASSAAPFYHGMSQVGEDPEIILSTVELVYPWRFLKQLCTTGATEARAYCLGNRLDPYASFVFGTYWLRELNR